MNHNIMLKENYKRAFKLLNIDYLILRTNSDLKNLKKKLRFQEKNIIACLIEKGTLKSTRNKNKHLDY